MFKTGWAVKIPLRSCSIEDALEYVWQSFNISSDLFIYFSLKKILKLLFTLLHCVDWPGKSSRFPRQPGVVSSDLFQNSTVLFDSASVYRFKSLGLFWVIQYLLTYFGVFWMKNSYLLQLRSIRRHISSQPANGSSALMLQCFQGRSGCLVNDFVTLGLSLPLIQTSWKM